MSDLNQRPSDYKSDALPAELIRRWFGLYTDIAGVQAFLTLAS